MGQIVGLISELDWDALSPFHDQFYRTSAHVHVRWRHARSRFEFAASQDFGEVRRVQNELLESYKKDFSKYADKLLAERLHLIWNAIPQTSQRKTRNSFSSESENQHAQGNLKTGCNGLKDASLIHRVKK